jgi:hypothetical protein
MLEVLLWIKNKESEERMPAITSSPQHYSECFRQVRKYQLQEGNENFITCSQEVAHVEDKKKHK